MPDAAWLEQQLTAGTLTGIGELVFNYAGIAPDDSAMADYWALAARHDVPTFVHIGRGPAPGQGLAVTKAAIRNIRLTLATRRCSDLCSSDIRA